MPNNMRSNALQNKKDSLNIGNLNYDNKFILDVKSEGGPEGGIQDKSLLAHNTIYANKQDNKLEDHQDLQQEVAAD